MVNIQATMRSPQVLRGFGNNGVGACIVPGVSVGDTVLGVYNISTLASASSSFQSTVTVQFQVQQSSSTNLSTAEFWFITVPGGPP